MHAFDGLRVRVCEDIIALGVSPEKISNDASGIAPARRLVLSGVILLRAASSSSRHAQTTHTHTHMLKHTRGPRIHITLFHAHFASPSHQPDRNAPDCDRAS